jgi:hypothetical protein
MYEGKLAKRLAAVAITTMLAVDGCGQTQVNGMKVVDYDNGPKTGEVTVSLANGGEMSIGGERTTEIVKIHDDDGILRIWRTQSDHSIVIFGSGDHNLGDGEVGVDSEGVIYARDGNTYYQITASPKDSQNGYGIDVKAACR